jgi:acetylornithine deacetylase
VTPGGLEARVLDAIDTEELLATLAALIAVPSVGNQEEPAQRLMAEFLTDAGMDVDLWQIDMARLRRHPSFSEEIPRDLPLGVVGRLRGSGTGASLMFNGHVDVVGAGELAEWTLPPWELTVRDGCAYGRGAVDMKGGLACALAAIRALGRAGVKLQGDLSLASVVGEEDGGVGTLAMLERGHTADAAVVMEPTTMAIAPAHAGALNFRIRLRGRAAHGCVREEGVSAIGLLPPLLAALESLERERNRRYALPLFSEYELPFALCVGRVRGGDWPATVAESAVVEGRYGIAPGEPLEAARSEFELAIADLVAADPWLRDHPPELEWWGGRFEPAAIPADSAIVAAAAVAFETVSGSSPRIMGMTYGADMRLLVNDGGIPTIMFGPGDVRAAHRADEYVPVADLLTVTRALALLAIRFCGAESV